MRQALKLLSEEPAAASGQTAANDEPPVSSSVAVAPQAVVSSEGSDDDTDTAPLPVILPGAVEVPRPQTQDTPRGPFEPVRVAPSADAADPAPEASAAPADAELASNLSPAAAEKLDQIKDLLITAEALGEVNLDRHFDRVSQRQRELIREFFERAIPDREPEA